MKLKRYAAVLIAMTVMTGVTARVGFSPRNDGLGRSTTRKLSF